VYNSLAHSGGECAQRAGEQEGRESDVRVRTLDSLDLERQARRFGLLRALLPRIRRFDRFVSIAELKEQGWQAADLHVHTSCSYDVVKAPWLHPEKLFQKALSLGMSFITFTDHDTMEAYDLIGWNRERLVPGVEIKVRDRREVGHTIHVNVYLLNRKQFRELEHIAQADAKIESFLAYLEANHLPYIYNHPFWFEPGETPNYSVVPYLIQRFPVTEYNMHRVRRKNALTMTLAAKFQKGVVATTDTHTGDLGTACTLAPGATFSEFFANIEQRNVCLVPRDLTLSVLSDEMIRWMELIFDPRLTKAQTRIRTGINKLDEGLSAVMKGALRNRPLLKAFCERFGYAVSWSRLAAWWYLQSENSKANEINQRLRAAGLV
jgi:predicted metal-dependent phosphoesterase TrpH